MFTKKEKKTKKEVNIMGVLHSDSLVQVVPLFLSQSVGRSVGYMSPLCDEAPLRGSLEVPP